MQKSLTPRFLTIGVILAWAVYALLPTWEYQQMTEEEKDETTCDCNRIESIKMFWL